MNEIEFWIIAVLFLFSMLMMVCGFIAQIIFVARYGEQVRTIVLGIEGRWTPLFVDFTKPTKPWDVVGVFFFTGWAMATAFTRKKNFVNDTFKARLPKNIFNYLKWLRRTNYTAVILLLISGGYFYLQQHGLIS